MTVILLDEGYASTAIGPIEVFHSAGLLWNSLRGEVTQPRFRVRIASIDGSSVTSLCALGLTPQFSIDDIKHTDVVILPASGLDVQDRIARNTALLPWLRKWHARGAYIAGICSGAAFLAESGLLDGREATTHWAVAEALRRRYPKVRWRPENFVTEDNRVLCSGGVYSPIDLSLYPRREILRPRNRAADGKGAVGQHAAQPSKPATRWCRCHNRTPTTK